MGRVGNVLLVNGEPGYALRVHRGRGGAVLSHQRRQLAHVQPLVRRRADQGARIRREPVRARGARAERRAGAGGAVHRGGAVRAARALPAGQRGAGHQPLPRASSRPRSDTLGIVTVDSAPAAPDHGAAFDHAARQRRRRPVTSSRFRPYFDKPPDKRLTLTVPDVGPAARHRAVHDDRHRLLRAGGVGGRHAGHELALDLEAGALGPARRRDRARRTATSTGT